MNQSKELAIRFVNNFCPEASLLEIEEQIWRLKLRNIPNGEIFRILKLEYSKEESSINQSSDSKSQIRVENLPDEFTREDWS